MVHWIRQQQQQDRTTGRPLSLHHETSSSVAYKNKNETFRQGTKIKKLEVKKEFHSPSEISGKEEDNGCD